MIIEYDGTNYVGWQTQLNGLAVQEVIEKAISEVTGETLRIEGSGRTDSGVHAVAQVAHFDTDARMAADKFAIAINTHLPSDIRILYSEEAPTDFHSRFSAKRKEYRYAIQLGPHARVFESRTSLHVHYDLDIQLMEHAARQFLGEHDFRAFMSTGTTIENTIRTIYKSEWSRIGDLLLYNVAGNGFLYNMVRIMVGTMLEIGMHKSETNCIVSAFETLDRNYAGSTAPAHGLTLYRVSYDGFDTEEILSKI